LDYLLWRYGPCLPEIAQPVVDESERDLHPEIVGLIRDADIAAVGWDVLGAVWLRQSAASILPRSWWTTDTATRTDAVQEVSAP